MATIVERMVRAAKLDPTLYDEVRDDEDASFVKETFGLLVHGNV